MSLPAPSKLIKGRDTEKYIIKHFPDLYNYLIYNLPQELSFKERVFWYKNGLTEYPTCKVCGKKVNFINTTKGYSKYCSAKCVNNSPDVKSKKSQTSINKFGSIEAAYKDRLEKTKSTILSKYESIEAAYKDRFEKTKKTNLERYGVEYRMGTEEFIKETKNSLINKFGSIEDAYKDRLEKTKKTNLERYGVECRMGTEEFKNEVRKTNLERYGVENPMQNNNVKEKVKKTNLERYGVECTFLNREQKIKTKQTMVDKYGVEYAQQNKKISDKSKNTKLNKIIESSNDIISIDRIEDELIYTYQCPHPNCDKCDSKLYQCSPYIHYNRSKHGSELCTKLLPVSKSHSQGTSLELFIRDILDRNNISYLNNVRNIITPYELDIYIPDKNIAIECNGCYWHSDENKNNNYHINKYKNCLEKGIQLITIWEDQVINQPDIIVSIILSKLGIYNTRIYGRCCDIREVSSAECCTFLNNNHLQGNVNSPIRLGLYYDNELISIMTFGSGRKSLNTNKIDGCYELYRYCNKMGVQVVGGASKLFKYFINNYNPTSIISFASNDISNGSLYDMLGFDKISENESYWYIDKNYNRYHRYRFRKSELVKMGYDKSKTETEIMREIGYWRIYDSGQTKFLWKVK